MTLFYKEYGVGKYGLHKSFRIVHDEEGVRIEPILNIGVIFYELFFDFIKNPQYLVLFCYLHIIFIYICGSISLIFVFWSQNLRTFPSFYAFSGLFLKMASFFTYLFLYFFLQQWFQSTSYFIKWSQFLRTFPCFSSF